MPKTPAIIRFAIGMILGLIGGLVWHCTVFSTLDAHTAYHHIRHNLTFTFAHLGTFPVAMGFLFAAMEPAYFRALPWWYRVAAGLGGAGLLYLAWVVIYADFRSGRPAIVELKAERQGQAKLLWDELNTASRNWSNHQKLKAAATTPETHQVWQREDVRLEDAHATAKDTFFAAVPLVGSLSEVGNHANAIVFASFGTTCFYILFIVIYIWFLLLIRLLGRIVALHACETAVARKALSNTLQSTDEKTNAWLFLVYWFFAFWFVPRCYADYYQNFAFDPLGTAVLTNYHLAGVAIAVAVLMLLVYVQRPGPITATLAVFFTLLTSAVGVLGRFDPQFLPTLTSIVDGLDAGTYGVIVLLWVLVLSCIGLVEVSGVFGRSDNNGAARA